MQKENQANLALALSLIGMVGTIGQNGIFMATIHHGFLAATIGGLADWFAVKAIFGRPLGISHRTDILRRNRARIMESLVTFASEDLLSRQNIMNVVAQENIGALLVEYLEHRGGRERLVEAVIEILRHVSADVDERQVARELTPYVARALHDLPMEEHLVDLLDILNEERHIARIFAVLIRLGTQVIRTEAFQEMLRENIASIRASYERDGMIRAFVLSFFDDEMICDWLTAQLDDLMQSCLDPEDRRHQEGVQTLCSFIRNLRDDPSLQASFSQYKGYLIARIDITSMIENFIKKRMKGNHPFWIPYVKELLHEKMDRFAASDGWKSRTDRFIKALISEELSKHHDAVAEFIREYLNKKSDDELVAFVERKIRKDLQIIRINGAVVGGCAGMLLSLLVTLAERMWAL